MNSPALTGLEAALPARVAVAAPPAPAPATDRPPGRGGGRYRALAAALALLAGLDLALLALNLQLSTQLRDDFAAAGGLDLLRSAQMAALAATLLAGGFAALLLRRLARAERAAAAAGRETRRILANVQEGLFLVDARFRLGRELTDSVHALLGCRVQPGEDFFELLAPLIDAQALAEAREYAALLFAPHVKLSLVADLNPLTAVAVNLSDGRALHRKYLSFDFRRSDAADGGDGAPALLVTVRDVTERVALQQALDESRQQATGELATLVEALAADRDALVAFLGRAEQGLLEINSLLEEGRGLARRDELNKLLEKMARQMHAIKGDAGALQLPLYASLAHGFEDALGGLRGDGALDGEALLALPPLLDEMLAKTRLLRRLVGASESPAGGGAESGPRARALAATVQALVQNTAGELGKRAEQRVDLAPLDALPELHARALHEAVVQLVRNAVVHGLESPAQRAAAGKLETGLVEVLLRVDDAGRAQLTVRDDGAGIDPAAVRAYLSASGKLPAAAAAALSDQDAVQWLFQPGASTRGAADRHAGRGIGLDVVHAVAERIGGRLRMQTRPGRFCEFGLQFQAEQAAS